MSWRQRAQLPVAVPRQQDRWTLAIDPATLQGLTKLSLAIVNLIVNRNNKIPPTPVPLPVPVPVQTIVPGGVLTVSFGTITITSGFEIIWSNGSTTGGFVGCMEAFVVNDIVYVLDSENSYFRYFGSNPSSANNISFADYEAVKATALVVITAAVIAQ